MTTTLQVAANRPEKEIEQDKDVAVDVDVDVAAMEADVVAEVGPTPQTEPQSLRETRMA